LIRRVKRKTVLKELSALRSLISFLHEVGYIDTKPVVPPLPKRATGTPDSNRKHKAAAVELSDDEVLAVLAKLPERSKRIGRKSRRHAVVKERFVFAYETGLRPATVAKLHVEHYDKETKLLTIPDEIDKARYGRTLPLTEEAIRALEKVMPNEGVIFGEHNLNDYIRAAAKEAGLHPKKVSEISQYDLRHARLTAWAGTGDLPSAAYMAGHKHVTTTNRYVHPSLQGAKRLLVRMAQQREAQLTKPKTPAFGTHTGRNDQEGGDDGKAK
jgi:integrase